MKRFKIFFIVLCSVFAAKAQSIVFNNQVPKYEVRAVWLTTIGGIDWPTLLCPVFLFCRKAEKGTDGYTGPVTAS